MLQDELWRTQNQNRVLDPTWRMLVWLAGVPVAFAAIRWGAPFLGVAYPVIVAACTVITLAAVNLIIVAMLPSFDRQGERLRDVFVPVLLAVVVALAEIAIAGYLRLVLERMARS
jgi:hypothetical protein